MQFKKLLSDDEGVSPVIGVILMVAITVILAAVIAAFVLGLGDSDDVAPQTSFDFDYDEGEDLTITATSGDTIDGDQVTLEGSEFSNPGPGTEWSNSDAADEDVTAGSSVTVDEDTDGEIELNVVWESDDGDDSSILASFDGPDA